MRLSDLPADAIRPGLRFRSLIDNNRVATVVSVDTNDDDYVWCKWDGDENVYSGWYRHLMAPHCEVVTDANGNPLYVSTAQEQEGHDHG